jgi:predicted nucleic acid-binding protein
VKYLVDANVLSEPTRASPAGRVVQWLRDHEADLVVDPIVLGELELGVLRLPKGRRRLELERWLQQTTQQLPCLPMTAQTAGHWARLLAELQRRGLAMPIKDSLIAATALAHGLTVVTRNTRDFQRTGVALIDPFGD